MASALVTARRWAWLIVLVLGVGLFELVRWVCVGTGNANLLPAMLLLGACVVPLSFATFLYVHYPQFQVPPALLVFAAAVGGLIGMCAAGFLEWDTLQDFGALPTVAVAITEETAKLLVPAAVLLFVRQVRPAEGLLLGVACGAGFAVLETLGYSAVALMRSHENIGAVDDLLFQRGVFSPATHIAWSGILAAALWSAARQRWSARSVTALIATFVLVVALHTAWDSASSVAGYIALTVVDIAIFAAAVHLVAQPSSDALPAVRSSAG